MKHKKFTKDNLQDGSYLKPINNIVKIKLSEPRWKKLDIK